MADTRGSKSFIPDQEELEIVPASVLYNQDLDDQQVRMNNSRTALPSNELQVYTWKDATLKELMSLVPREGFNPDAMAEKATMFDFCDLVFHPDARRGGFYHERNWFSQRQGRKGADDAVTLESKKFQIGAFPLMLLFKPPRMGQEERQALLILKHERF
ncbi:Histone deacetylase complex subunit sap18 [Desmophyllum pertusum]|uniref:18 kDa Sin3-associated polypeptide n=1 Tax=Desmophyllum pertusum TaxID=174260 RepID=A0A9W9YU78_9CNID|nr:Histone deacetylase complex subunit sap18 [Desmophyllum pertusum]